MAQADSTRTVGTGGVGDAAACSVGLAEHARQAGQAVLACWTACDRIDGAPYRRDGLPAEAQLLLSLGADDGAGDEGALGEVVVDLGLAPMLRLLDSLAAALAARLEGVAALAEAGRARESVSMLME